MITPAQQINSQILAFIRKRENQFRMVMRSGQSIPHYAKKIKAMTEVRTMMEGAASYNLQGQAWAVLSVESSILYILPAADSRFTSMRNQILGLIDYCREQVAQKPQINGLTFNAGETYNCISR